MGAVFDANLMFRTTGSLTQNESSGALKVKAVPIHGMAVEIIVPTANGANDTLCGKLYWSTDGTNYYVIAQSSTAVKPGTAGATFIIPFSLPNNAAAHYLKLEMVGTAASTTYNFGAVKSGIVLGRGADVERRSNRTVV